MTSAIKDNEEYICVTLNAPDDWNDHTYLLNYGFDNYENKSVFKKGERALRVVYDKKYNRRVNLVFAESFDIAVTQNDIITTVIEKSKIKYPAKKGTVAGYGYVYCNGEEIGKIPLVTEKDINKMTLIEKIKYFFRNLKK